MVDYVVMDLQKWDKCNRGYYLQTECVMWVSFGATTDRTIGRRSQQLIVRLTVVPHY